MRFFNRESDGRVVPHEKASPQSSTPERWKPATSIHGNDVPVTTNAEESPRVTPLALILGAVASIGGFMFGYESGQISGT